MAEKTQIPRILRSIETLSPFLIGLGILLLIVNGGSGLGGFYRAWTFGWVFWMSITFGCFGMMLICYMVRARWCRPLISLFEAGSSTMLPMGVAAIPFVVAAYTHHLYPWAHPSVVARDTILQYRSVWFNPNWFLLRTFMEFMIFGIMVFGLLRSSKIIEITGSNDDASKRAANAAGCFVVSILLITVAVTDWIMSLDRHWYSTIYGFIFTITAGLTAMGLCVAIALQMRLDGEAPYVTLVDRLMTRDWGNLLLVLTMVWAYFNLCQYIIQWSGNLPEEVSYYVARNAGLLAFVTVFFVIIRFFIPFLLLISSRLKRVPTMLRNTALLIFFAQVLDQAWNVIPMFHSWSGPGSGLRAQLQSFPGYFGSLFLIGGIWTFLFVLRIKQNALVPNEDPQILEALNHAHS